ncbi:MAG: hypothetical protein ACKVG9_03370 [Rhodospirillales bacterium]
MSAAEQVNYSEAISNHDTFEYQKDIKREGFCKSAYHRPEISRDPRVRNFQMAIPPVLVGIVIGTTAPGFMEQMLGGGLLLAGVAWAAYWLTRPAQSEA